MQFLHSSMPTVEVLYRIRKERPDVFDKLEGPSTSLFLSQLILVCCPSLRRRRDPSRNRCVLSICNMRVHRTLTLAIRCPQSHLPGSESNRDGSTILIRSECPYTPFPISLLVLMSLYLIGVRRSRSDKDDSYIRAGDLDRDEVVGCQEPKRVRASICEFFFVSLRNQ